jgi:hypothetical protein
MVYAVTTTFVASMLVAGWNRAEEVPGTSVVKAVPVVSKKPARP